MLDTEELIVNVTAFEMALVAFNTVTLALPVFATRLAGTTAVNWVELPKAVARPAPFHCTVELLVKPVPLTVRLKAEAPAVTAAGLRVEMLSEGVVEGVPVTTK